MKRNQKKRPTGRRKKKAVPELSLKQAGEIVVTGIFLALTIILLKDIFVTYPTAVKEKITPLSSDARDGILEAEEGPCGRPEIKKAFLAKNEYSRSGRPLKKVKGIVIHYVANPGSTAMENRDYFNNLQNTHLTKASSHFIIGLEGEIIQCIPLNEISYASNQRNKDTISIECCHPGKSGKFNEKTYASAVQLSAWLCETYGIDSSDVIRHYDVTGKQCPVYFVKHKKAWNDFLAEIKKKLDENAKIQEK